MVNGESTKSRALTEGRRLLQRFGFDGFSFQDIADKLRLRKQSLYAHFKSKEALGIELIEEYQLEQKVWKQTVSFFKPEDQINTWFEHLYQFASEDLKYCAIAAFASDYNSLSKKTRRILYLAYAEIKDWFIAVIAKGQSSGVFRRDINPEELTEQCAISPKTIRFSF